MESVRNFRIHQSVTKCFNQVNMYFKISLGHKFLKKSTKLLNYRFEKKKFP